MSTLPQGSYMTDAEDKLEKAFASSHKVLSYKDILDKLGNIQNVGELIKGDPIKPEFMPSYYYKKLLDDDKYSTLRIGNHAPTMRMYYIHSNGKVPTSKIHGNLSIMFYGINEVENKQKYILRNEKSKNMLKVYEKDFMLFKPFRLHHVHYRTGYMTVERFDMLKHALEQWGSGNGEVAFVNPFGKDEHITPLECEYDIKVILKSQKKANEALVRIEGGTKYLDVIQLNPIEIVDSNGCVIDSGYVYAFLLNTTVVIGKKPIKHEDFEYDEDGTMNFYI
jgi:hypothetical protein